MAKSGKWITVTESKYSWERDALEFVRAGFPDHEPYRAWTNFEFIADDGSINEVDLLVFTPQGFFLIEIKSRPGELSGDAGTWTWETDGRRSTVDSPLIAANLKSKKLRTLLERQKACRKIDELPWLEPLVFCSAPGLQLKLQDNGRQRVCLRDRPQEGGRPARPGILAAIMRRECPGLGEHAKGTCDTPMAKVLGRAMEQAGIRPSQRQRKVSDYLLEQLIGEGPGYQDWQAAHTQVSESKRRVRLYLVRNSATEDERRTRERAARREFQILETLSHPGILRVHSFTEHELGPALLFEHDPLSLRLDHYLAQQQDSLSIDARLDLMRQIAEVVRYAHDRKVVHRGLCPQSILVTDIGSRPRIRLFNWQVGYRAGTATSEVSRPVSATSHLDELVEDVSKAYLAPEALTDESTGEHLDVFSLGAIAYHIFSGVRPAANGLELSERLRGTSGLQISSVLNGAGEYLQMLVQDATHPIVSNRTDSVLDFLDGLNLVEDELTTPEFDYVDDPSRAKKGDLIEGGLTVVRRLGEGSCSVALLVSRDGQDYVLKVASDPEHNERIRGEAGVLGRPEMRHPCIVHLVELLETSDRVGFLMRPVYAEKGRRSIETLRQRLRKEGRLHIDYLQRFGEDLLNVVNHLEEQGVPHRDIKPDNLAVGMVGRGDSLHLVLFDFSLSRTPAANIRAGTSGYLDPLLPLRKSSTPGSSPRWDLHAERYAAAVTLHEMATGELPKWGDGTTDPSQLPPHTEISLDAELFDAGLRDQLGEFFTRAFRRSVDERFDNAEEMLRGWRKCFEDIDQSAPGSDHADENQLETLLAEASFDTHIAELGLGTRATNALDRANVLTVEDLLTVPMRRLLRLRGVGNKTRREITAAVRILRRRLGRPDREEPVVTGSEAEQAETIEPGSLSVDLLIDRLLRTGSREGETVQRTIQLLLGLDAEQDDPWPSQAEVARLVGVSRARVGQVVGRLQERWAKEAGLTRLRTDLYEILRGQGGVMSIRELAEAVLVARGSSHDEPRRTLLSRAVIRAAFEVERTMAEPRYLVRRDGNCVLLAQNTDLAGYARALGDLADTMAREDPLLAPARCIELLREVAFPGPEPLPDPRLLRLAAEASEHAAVSSRQELYPRGMPASRALRLSQGALLGMKSLTVAQIRERVAGRYPEAEELPDHPALKALLDEAGLDFDWDPRGRNGTGCYTSRYRDTSTVSSASGSSTRWPMSSSHGEAGPITPEEADARQFEDRLRRAADEGAFLALVVDPRKYDRAMEELCRRFPLQLVDFEGLFLDALRQVAEQARVDWNLVLQTDARPHEGDWDRLMMLVRRSMPVVEQQLLAAEQTMLLIYPGLLARYDQMDLLSRLHEKVGRRNGVPGLWLLLSGDSQAMLDGQPVPLIGPGQRVRVPESWLRNTRCGDAAKQKPSSP